jgi:hypothetical protein
MVLSGHEDDVRPHEYPGNKISSDGSNRQAITAGELISPYLLTDGDARPIVPLWGELTPRGNMVHKGIKREDGVQDQLVLGSLKSSQGLRRT